MNFGFSDEQKSLGDTVERMLADFPGLTAPDLAPTHADGVWEGLAELGLFSLLVPEDREGAGLSWVDLALAVEALGAGLAPLSVASTLAVSDVIARHGSEHQQATLLPRIAGGQLRAAIAVSEPDRGYDARSFGTRLVNGTLSGSKLLVADAASADLIVVVAQVDDQPGLVMIDPAMAGVIIEPHETLDPTTGACALTLDAAGFGRDALIGGADGVRAVERLLDVSATLYAGILIGIAARMLDAAVAYAKSRVQFGQPIGGFQAIKHRCADMAVSVEAGRSAAYYAFWAIAEGAPDCGRAVSMAKAYCGDITRTVCNDALQVHGGMGFTWELGLHRFLRRTKVLEHAFGDQAWHNERVFATTLADLAKTSPSALEAS